MRMMPVSLINGDETRNARVTASGTRAATRPMKIGIELQEQNGVIAPSTTATTMPTTSPRPASTVRTRSGEIRVLTRPITNISPSSSSEIFAVS